VPNFNIQFVVQAQDEASGVFGKIGRAVGSLGGLAQGVLTIGLGAAAGGLAALGAGLGLAVHEAMGAQEVMAQTEAVIKSTGGAAGLTAQQISDMATALSKHSRFADDSIQEGQNLLLTFTNIGKDVFPAATQAMVDMAAALKTDVAGGAMQLGKALNDPINGITALRRVGVSFSEDQEKVIKRLVQTGDVAGAQRLILEELNKEFGGSAQAAADTFAGKLDVLKNSLLNVAEGIGGPLIEAGTGLMDRFVLPALPAIESLGGAVAGFFGALSAGQDPLTAIATLAGQFIETLGFGQQASIDAQVAIFGLRGTFADAATAVQPLVSGAQSLAQAFIDSMPMIRQTVGEMATFVKDQFAQLSPTLIANVSTTLSQIGTFWRNHGDEIMAGVKIAWEFIVVTIGGALTLASGLIAAVMQAVNGDWRGAWQTIVTTVKTFLNSALSIVGTNLDEFIATWKGNWELAKTIVTTLWTRLKEAVAAKVMELTSGIQQAIIDSINWLRSLPETFQEIGTDLMNGLKSGIVAAAAGVIGAATGAVTDAIQAAKNLLGIHSPSKVFIGIGRQMMAGMAAGISGNAAVPALAMQGASSSVVNNTTYNITGGMYAPQDRMTMTRELRLIERMRR
jgi:phage-related protein